MVGCWHLLRTHDEPLPGLITGTGLEDGVIAIPLCPWLVELAVAVLCCGLACFVACHEWVP